MASRAATVDGARSARLTTLIICAIAHNLAIGLAYGSFGPLLLANQQHWGVSRTEAVLGVSLISISVGLLSPLAGRFLHHMPMRGPMMFGALLTGLGYFGLAFTDSYPMALACYTLLGVGVSLDGLIGPITLVTRWYDRGRGKAMSILTLPLVLFVSPFLVAILLPQVGRSALFAAFGALFILLIVLLAVGVKEPPRDTFETATAAKNVPAQASPLRSEGFWLIAIPIAISAGVGSAFMVHAVAFGMGEGMTLATAAALTSVYAGAGVIGTPVFGWLADRIGPSAALALSMAIQAILWLFLTYSGGPVLFAIAFVLGMTSIATTALLGAGLANLFGAGGVAKAVGYAYFVKLPFLFAVPPVVAALFEATGGYGVPFLVCTVALGVGTVCAIRLMSLSRRKVQLATSG